MLEFCRYIQNLEATRETANLFWRCAAITNRLLFKMNQERALLTVDINSRVKVRHILHMALEEKIEVHNSRWFQYCFLLSWVTYDNGGTEKEHTEETDVDKRAMEQEEEAFKKMRVYWVARSSDPTICSPFDDTI